jgi:hypothetical protein
VYYFMHSLRSLLNENLTIFESCMATNIKFCHHVLSKRHPSHIMMGDDDCRCLIYLKYDSSVLLVILFLSVRVCFSFVNCRVKDFFLYHNYFKLSIFQLNWKNQVFSKYYDHKLNTPSINSHYCYCRLLKIKAYCFKNVIWSYQ